jgi:glycosyltransferase involved in cell wall biosynthesis
MPTVSIVVPCYNGGQFLDALVASIRAQTFRDFETIIVDDGSTDVATREKLAALPADIQVVRQENGGLSSARNAGFRAAQAQIVLPLDCDDTLEPTHLAETVPLLLRAPPEIGFVFAYERLVGARSGIMEFYFNPFDQLFANRMSYCLLMRKSVWENAGGYDETMRDGYEDWEFNIRIAKCGYQGICVPKPLVNYLVSNSGMLMSKSSQLHGKIWRKMRAKHADLYRPTALLALWRRTRAQPGKISLPVAAALLSMAHVLPESWFSALIHRVRRARMSDGASLAAATVT